MSLIDSIERKRFPCQIKQCSNTFELTQREALESLKNKNFEAPHRMCDECYSRFQKLEDLQVTCATHDCNEVITIKPYKQLADSKKKKSNFDPMLFCESCHEVLKNLAPRNEKCRLQHCDNTWEWYPASQLKKLGRKLEGQADPRLCQPCAESLKKLQVKEIPCRIKHCSYTWRLERLPQLDLQKKKNVISKRLCLRCAKKLKELAVKQVPCAMPACNNSWDWNTFSQLEHFCKQESGNAEELKRYCNDCFHYLRQTKSKTKKCHTSGCKNQIQLSAEEQLRERLVKRKKGDKAELFVCQECTDCQDQLQSQEIECKQQGCSQTFTWTKEEQISQIRRQGKGWIQNTHQRHCDSCLEFMKENRDQKLVCQKCQTQEISWTINEQLMCHLGVWTKPTTCPQCLKT